MSFLDRFQNKIATVTAHGHLKKADGSEEIRVGPPKRKTQPSASNGVKAAVDNQHTGHTHAHSIARGAHEIVAPLRHLSQDNARGKQPQQQPQQVDKGGATSARQSYPSPNASPRSKTHRDGYDGNNNYPHQQRYHEQDHVIPGRAVNADYGNYEKPQKRSPHKGGSPDYHMQDSRSHGQYQPPPQRYQSNAQMQQPPQLKSNPKNHSPVSKFQAPQDELPSPRDRNEARVQTDEDQLAFSRKARPVQFAPCTLSQYKKEKPAAYYELGKLQPDLNADELVQKRANMERIKSFSKNLRAINMSSGTTKKVEKETNSAAQRRATSSREKALEFSKHVPKPRIQQRPLADSAGALSSASSSESLPTIHKRARPVNSVQDDDADEDDVSSELQALQMRHQASRAQVEALIRNA